MERSDEGHATPDADELVAQVELLRAENERLRRSYARARRAKYRRTAAGFVLLGLLATAGAVLFPDVRTVLLALGGTGVFAGVLTWFVTPERFVSASVGRAVYEAFASNYADLAAELGLEPDRVYVPATGTAGVRLFVPQRDGFAVPDADALASVFVVTDDPAERGVALTPSGERLFREFETALQDFPADEPGPLVETLREGLVEQFEIAGSVTTDLDAGAGRLTLAAPGNAYGPLDQFDHPVVSFVAVGLARGLDRPVSVEIAAEEGDPLATFRWDAPERAEDATEPTDESDGGTDESDHETDDPTDPAGESTDSTGESGAADGS